jgi:hypothetical protein
MISHSYYYVGHLSPVQVPQSPTEWSEPASSKEQPGLFYKKQKENKLCKRSEVYQYDKEAHECHQKMLKNNIQKKQGGGWPMS